MIWTTHSLPPLAHPTYIDHFCSYNITTLMAMCCVAHCVLCVLLAFLGCRYLFGNQLTGSIPESLGQLSSLETLYVPAPRHLAVLGFVLRCVCVCVCAALFRS